MKLSSYILKIALFATGLSGIVAEYILSTLGSYFLGDSVIQWTLIVSIMLFSMGLGSGLSKYLYNNLIDKFIYIEFLLSILVSFSSLIAYSISAVSNYTGFVIYFLSISIGILIGMEIPLVVRLNNEFQILRINVASIVEKDYYGSLVGGIFFAFVGLPILGITYTPFVLGFINFSVAMVLFVFVKDQIRGRKRLRLALSSAAVFVVIISGVFFAQPIILYGEQTKYKDKIIYSEQTQYQKIVMTQWKDEYWLYIDGNQQLSTIDEVMYHEPLVHPVMQLLEYPKDILVLGGGDGCAVREILKYPSVEDITVVDLDPAMTELGKTHPVLTQLNDSALYNPKVEIFNTDGFEFLEERKTFYDAIFIDLPDPKTVEMNRLYSYEFYRSCRKHLRPHGALITQAGSPYYATRAFLCINKTMKKAGFATQKLHNQILTLGEWGWILGSKHIKEKKLTSRLQGLTFKDVPTEWINNEAMQHITTFGKKIYPGRNGHDTVEVNTIFNPVLYRYYLEGNWDLY